MASDILPPKTSRARLYKLAYSTSSSILEDASQIPQILPLDNTFTTDMCEVHVGQEPAKVIFHVHKAVLGGASPFFKAALTGNFIEATTNKLALPSEQPVIFSGILKAIYSGTETGILKAFAYDPAGSTALEVAGRRPVFVELWLSLDRLQLNAMKLAFMSFLNNQPLNNFRPYVSVENVVYVYQNTFDKSPLRSVMVEVLVPAIVRDPKMLDGFAGQCGQDTGIGNGPCCCASSECLRG